MASPLLGRGFGLLCFCGVANGLAAPGPAETFKPMIPFNAMNAIPTPAPVLPIALRHQLGKRADDSTPVLVAPDNTCGYVSGASIASFTCVDADATCVLVSSTGAADGIVGCCGAVDCGFRTTCVDSSQIAAGSCGSSCSTDTNIVKCSSGSLTFCNSISFSGGAVDYFCAEESATAFFEAETTFSGQTGRTYTTVDLAETESDTTATGTSSEPEISNIRTIVSTQTPSNTNPPDDNDDGGTPTGAIVGGAVGGAAVLALIALGIWLILRKKKRKPDVNTTQTTNNYGPSPSQPPPPQMYQNQPQYGHPGHQSIFSDPNTPYTPQPGNPQQTPSPFGYQDPNTAGNSAGAAAAGGFYPDQKAPPHNATHDAMSPESNYNRFSMQTQNTGPGVGAAAGPSYTPAQGVPPPGGQTRPVESGGAAVGYNDNHKGQLHELA